MWHQLTISILAVVFSLSACHALAEDWSFQLRYQEETEHGSGRFHRLTRTENWSPNETAIVVCDVWDLHHCFNAVSRLNQFAPRLNDVLVEARGRGATIIHSPSDCMPAYAEHPARRRAITTPVAANLPPEAAFWCSTIPGEELGKYPLDQSDGGEDDDPAEHAQWVEKLVAMGRNAGTPWQYQSAHIKIDPERDFISDRGDEVWNILESRGIKHVILTGVHVNMCVIGRPFGLRQMARNGKNVALMRDMTDAMYNPKRWPYVSHLTGNDLIISHIERFVSPTMTSDEILGGQPFKFRHDSRPHLVIVCAEEEYSTETTLPKFALEHLGHHFQVSYVWGDATDRNSLPGLEVLNQADAMLVSVRRRLLTPNDMALVKRFVAQGKPVIGIRTASHAFSLRKGEVPQGLADWPEFDAQVFGGSYTNHHGNGLLATAVRPHEVDHPIVANIDAMPFATGGSLYRTSPLKESARPLLFGSVEGKPKEPLAWTFLRRDGGRSFYTSLGHVDDFANPRFVRLLVQGIHWATGLPSAEIRFDRSEQHWRLTQVPDKQLSQVVWYRCVVRFGNVDGGKIETIGKAWLNGVALADGDVIPAKTIVPNDANLLVIRTERGLQTAPKVRLAKSTVALEGTWQYRTGDDASWSNMPLPAKFGAGSDIVFRID